jgi:hypothetical protein
MKKNKKNEFLEQLRKIPIILVACEKTNLSRNTVYRWRKESQKFAKEMDIALQEGEELVNDMSESQLLSMIKDREWSAVSFWLRHRNPKFKEKLEISGSVNTIQELSKEQKKLIDNALKMAGINQNEKY